MADHDFAGDFGARVMAHAGFVVLERKHAVDDRPDLMLFHHAAQVFEITTAASRNRLVCRLTQEHGHEVDAARHARQSTHEGYLAAIGDGLDRLRQRTGSADLHHSIHAAASRELAHLYRPNPVSRECRSPRQRPSHEGGPRSADWTTSRSRVRRAPWPVEPRTAKPRPLLV